MNHLKQYLGKYIRLIDTEGEEFIGYANIYTGANDNENGQEDIAIQTRKDSLVGFYFYENDIESIEILTEEEYNEALKTYKYNK